MREVVIAGYLRTAQSRCRPKDPERDWFHMLRADDLLAAVIPELLKRTGIESDVLDDFLVGSALGVTENWTYGGRTPVFLANLSEKTPAKFVDMQCGSSMAALHTGYLEIAGGYADFVLVSGMEHMTRVPMGPKLFKEGTISMNPGLFSEEQYEHWDMDTTMFMGLTAEKLLEQTGFSRREMDEWGVRSHKRAAAAHKGGFLKDEILTIEAPQADGSTMTVDRDQAVREDVTVEGMAELKSPFKEDGGITAGNASPLNAGAAAMVLCSREAAEAKGLTPLAKVISIGFAGIDPTIMGAAPVPAARRALDAAGMEPGQIDYWEINEAFSVVVLNFIRELGLDPERVNVMGGGLSIGHAMGATGVRITGTLARILNEKKARYGLAASCIGGGQGVATIIESIG